MIHIQMENSTKLLQYEEINIHREDSEIYVSIMIDNKSNKPQAKHSNSIQNFRRNNDVSISYKSSSNISTFRNTLHVETSTTI